MSLAAPFSFNSENTQKEEGGGLDEGGEGKGQCGRDLSGTSLKHAKTFSGKMTLIIVCAKVEGGAGPGASVTIDFHTDAGGLTRIARPVVLLSFQEWAHVAKAQKIDNAGSVPGKSAVKVVDHTVFSIHRIFVEATLPYTEMVAEEDGKEAAAAHSHSMPATGGGEEAPQLPAMSAVGAAMPMLRQPMRRRSTSQGRDRDDGSRALGEMGGYQHSSHSNRRRGWSSDSEDAGAPPSRSLSPRKNISSAGDMRAVMNTGDVRVVMNGVRLDCNARMLHSMLEVCLAHHDKIKAAEDRQVCSFLLLCGCHLSPTMPISHESLPSQVF